MAEYRRHLSGSGQPGAGDAFFYELSQREYGDTCERVPITPQGHTYAEFPKTKSLDHFDPADHKFVAVALASQHDPAVLNAVDSDWLHHQTTLEQEGVRIEQLCPDCLKELPE